MKIGQKDCNFHKKRSISKPFLKNLASRPLAKENFQRNANNERLARVKEQRMTGRQNGTVVECRLNATIPAECQKSHGEIERVRASS